MTGSMASTKVNRGLLYKAMGEYDLALKDLREATVKFEEIRYTFGIAAIFHNMGETFYSAQTYDSAISYLVQSQNMADEFEFLQH